MRAKVLSVTPLVIVLVLSIIFGPLLGSFPAKSVDAATVSGVVLEPATAPAVVADEVIPSTMGYFAKYDGIDGESIAKPDWINILSIDWGAHKATAGASGSSRRRSSAVIDDLVLTFLYEKSAPKLAEKCLKGELIDELEVELFKTFETEDGLIPKRYLRYELKNVMVTSYNISGNVESGVYPTVTVANSFEEITVTYTEYDEDGASKGNIEFTYDVEMGE